MNESKSNETLQTMTDKFIRHQVVLYRNGDPELWYAIEGINIIEAESAVVMSLKIISEFKKGINNIAQVANMKTYEYERLFRFHRGDFVYKSNEDRIYCVCREPDCTLIFIKTTDPLAVVYDVRL